MKRILTRGLAVTALAGLALAGAAARHWPPTAGWPW
jgi:hypothetical protein